MEFISQIHGSACPKTQGRTLSYFKKPVIYKVNISFEVNMCISLSLCLFGGREYIVVLINICNVLRNVAFPVYILINLEFHGTNS